MPSFVDLTGQRFGALTVLRRAETPEKRTKWVAVCDCGNEVIKRGEKLDRDGSCGCMARKRLLERITTHGLSGTRTHAIWVSMRQRCETPSSGGFATYGGSGIKFCERWRDFENFVADMGMAPEGKSIDRFPDGKGNYEPGNCRWATNAEQARNKRSNRNLTWKGETLCLTDWARRLGMRHETLFNRVVRYGWPIERAFTIPVTQRGDRRSGVSP